MGRWGAGELVSWGDIGKLRSWRVGELGGCGVGNLEVGQLVAGSLESGELGRQRLGKFL